LDFDFDFSRTWLLQMAFGLVGPVTDEEAFVEE